MAIRYFLAPLSVLALMVPVATKAQAKQGRQLIDSLQAELPKHHEDTTLVLMHAQLAKEYAQIDEAECDRQADTAIAMADRLHYLYGKAMALNHIGNSRSARNKMEEARIYFDQALTLFRQGNYKARVAMTLGNIGLTYSNSDPRRAIKSIEEAVATLRSMGDAVEKAKIVQGINFLGRLHVGLNEYDKALACYQEAYSADSATGNRQAMAGDLNGIGVCYKNLQEREKAIVYLKKGLEYAQQLGDNIGMALLLQNLSDTYIGKSDWPDAIATATEGLKLAEKAKNNNGYALLVLGTIYSSAGNYSKATEYIQQAIEAAQKWGNDDGVISGMAKLAEVEKQQGHYIQALAIVRRAIDFEEHLGKKDALGGLYRTVGDLYRFGIHDNEKAIEYYHLCLSTATEARYNNSIIDACSALANVYALNGNADSALYYTAIATPLVEKDGAPLARAILYQTEGDAWYAKNDKPRGFQAYARAKKAADTSGNKGQIRITTADLGWAYADAANDTLHPLPEGYCLPPVRKVWLDTGISEMFKAERIAIEAGDTLSVQEALGFISDAQAAGAYYEQALATYKEATRYRDAFFNARKTQQFLKQDMDFAYARRADSIRAADARRTLALQEAQALAALRFTYEQKQALARTEAERQQYRNEEALRRRQITEEHYLTQAQLAADRQRQLALAKAEADKRAALAAAELKRRQGLVRMAYVGGGLLFTGAVVALLAFFIKRRANKIIAAEQQRSEDLLYNILPAEVAAELKAEGSAAARQYDEVSVLFTDFVNFSSVAERLSPQSLVQELHECFSAFDRIMETYGLEKIKTIGDAYLAVSGLPQPNARHAQAAVNAALAIRDFMVARGTFGIRIGINSGPVVAGIVGVMKYSYDVWGNTVTVAAKMEQASETDYINISEATWQLVRWDFQCQRRATNNPSEPAMYFVEVPISKSSLQSA